MTKDCQEKISWLMTQGTKLDNEISVKLIEKNREIKRIKSFSNELNVAISTASRYVKKLGYPSFKHFMYEYNGHNYEQINSSDANLSSLTSKSSGKTIEDYELESNISRIGQKLKGKIYVISSQRSNAIAKLIIGRLKDARIETIYFNDNNQGIEEWIKNISSDDSVILITVSGYSLRIENALRMFEKTVNKPFGVVMTASKNLKIPSHFSLITPNVLSSKYHLNEWVEYNIVQLKIINIVTILLNSAFLYRNQNI